MYHCLTCIWLYTKRIHPHLPYIPKFFKKRNVLLVLKNYIFGISLYKKKRRLTRLPNKLFQLLMYNAKHEILRKYLNRVFSTSFLSTLSVSGNTCRFTAALYGEMFVTRIKFEKIFEIFKTFSLGI